MLWQFSENRKYNQPPSSSFVRLLSMVKYALPGGVVEIECFIKDLKTKDSFRTRRSVPPQTDYILNICNFTSAKQWL